MGKRLALGLVVMLIALLAAERGVIDVKGPSSTRGKIIRLARDPAGGFALAFMGWEARLKSPAR